MKQSDMIQSKYLGKSDIKAPTVAVIQRVSREQVKGQNGNEIKSIIYFAGLKPLIANVKNTRFLFANLGDDTDHWLGKSVEIYFDPNVEFAGEVVGGLRLRLPTNSSMTYEQALNACVQVGISKDELVAKLKEKGLQGWNSEKATPHVRAMIAAKQAERQPGDDMPFDDSPADSGDIPF